MFGFEMDILKFFQNLRTDFLNALFEYITMLGEETIVIVLVAIIYFAIDKRLAYRLFFATACSMGVNGVIKSFAKIPRPFMKEGITCVRPDTATGYSFPSGHTQIFSTWAPLLARQIKKHWFTALVCIAIPLVAVSRVYLGAHYPSDVVVGATLGVGFAFLGNYIFDKVQNKLHIFIGLAVVFAPFVAWFFIGADELYRDIFKFYGMVLGVIPALGIEKKFADMQYNVPIWKKALRVVIAVVLAFAVKEGIKALNVFGILQVTFLFDILRYFLLVVVVFGLCPIAFKKIRL
ncbi:MAG: phosphatase PAP2 family protein [Clostridia bacterium]|nr:phosphatase PAP2 family protein [Clostridia bacterium]